MDLSEGAWRQTYLDLLATAGEALLHYLFDLTGDLTLAEDLCQDCFASAWRHREQLRDPSKARSWLFAIASNAARAQFRREAVRRRWAPELHDGPGAATLAWEMPEQDLDLRQALAALTVDDRALVLLVGHQGYTIAEAAALLGLGEAAAGKRWQRACARLSRVLRRGALEAREARP